ncbi:COesterase domain-containing protein [Fusarium sp. Ph1]|nr:COesterase domain-containing protein [Fusarium sp. Ph1]
MNLKTFLLGSLSLLPYAHGVKPPLPTLDLPWGSYPATVLPADKKIYLFENVRFGAQPVRFGASDFPQDRNSSVQVAPKDTDCLQFDPRLLSNGPGGKSPLGDPNQDLDPHESHATDPPSWSGTEDCLFLDVYVPRSVFDDPGSQPPLPSRLGAFGWLAGSFMQTNGLPNAGLYDQNLLLRWVQKYIGKVHGDKNTVSAWGESAGGGSILHHLIRGNGDKNPLFTRFVTQSPAFEWAWDNSVGGQLDQVYQNFSNSLGCHAPYDIECIRNPSFSLETLALANIKLFENVKQTGLFPIGPSVDNAWIKTIPTLAFSQKKFWPGIKSAIVSHCVNDAQRFTPDSVTDNTTFYGFLTKFLPGDSYAPLRTRIANHYNCVRDYKGDYNLCLRHVIRDASFTCNTRDLLDSYPDQAYAMNYGFPNDALAYHATDLVPLFANVDIWGQIATMFVVGFNYSIPAAAEWGRQLRSTVIKPYLRYFSSFARYGNTNGTGDRGWPVVNGSGQLFSNVIKPSAKGWKLVEDDQNSKDTCAFWHSIAQDIMHPQPPPGWKTEDADMDTDVQEEL